ncbi:Hypothetical protein CINCED_3A019783 [Cinara cedri]|uniref:Uncharacterized protein n=1 Tax=Cinara cedri TaxID=506608 RepID=A0A5E4MXG2_9HEMI|nr:Hypothetical protein CINCED_3A019783 [Cinara cedri]
MFKNYIFIILDVKHKARDVSQSIERYVCDFTPDERRVLYDYAVQNTKLSNQDAIKDLTDVDVLNKSNEKPKTELELLQEQRDSKRRRVAYRGKRVHTDRKSHTEVLREVVEGLTNSLQSQQEQSTSICTETSSSGSQTVLNNRIVYKYEGIQNYGSNPYTRWLDIESEESKLIDSSEMKNYRPSYKTHYKESRSSSSRLQMSKRPKSRPRSYSSSNYSSKSSSKSRSRSRSRSRTRYKERNYKSKRYRSPTKYEKNKYKSSKTESISQETMPKESKIQPMSVESHFKKSKRHRSRTRSKSQDLNSYKKVKSSKSPINYFKLSIPNEEETTVKLKSSHAHKKKKKKKKSKRKHI